MQSESDSIHGDINISYGHQMGRNSKKKEKRKEKKCSNYNYVNKSKITNGYNGQSYFLNDLKLYISFTDQIGKM